MARCSAGYNPPHVHGKPAEGVEKMELHKEKSKGQGVENRRRKRGMKAAWWGEQGGGCRRREMTAGSLIGDCPVCCLASQQP